MTTAADRRNPFYAGTYFGSPSFIIDAPSRVEAAKSFTAPECRRALKLPGLQKNVIAALERRLRCFEPRLRARAA